MDRVRNPTWPLLVALALLAVTNLLTNISAAGLYLLWTSLAVLGLVWLAGADGLSCGQWGAGRIGRRAARAAAILAGVVAVALVVGTWMPGVAVAFDDQRVAGMTAWQVVFAAVVRAPLGTALLEEVAFRGVLLAMLAKRFGLPWAVVGSSVAFGVWHVVAASGLAAGNAAVGSMLGGSPLWAAAAGVIAAGLAGAFLCWLRIRYDHLVVPFAVHATANAMAYLLAWLMMRR